MGTALASIPKRIIVSDDDAYMTIGEVCERFRVSRSWVERKLRDEVLPFPQPLQFGGKTRRDVGDVPT